MLEGAGGAHTVGGLTVVVDSCLEIKARCSRGSRIYCKKAALCHLPRACIVESSIPARAAEVAAPMRKLWPVYILVLW